MKYLSSLLVVVIVTTLLLSFSTHTVRTVTGTVTNARLQPVANASIQVKGSSISTVTNGLGEFSIQVNTSKALLIITAVGYEQKECKVGTGSRMKIVLNATTTLLQEVVVGYGSPSKNIRVDNTRLHDNASLNESIAGVMPKERKALPSSTIYKDNSIHTYNEYNREGYDNITDNPFLKATDNPLSTFSIDVDGASYSNIRRMINSGQLPPAGAVRIEEMINYFSYNYAPPKGNVPFSIHTEYTVCPWNTGHQLVCIGLQGKKINTEKLPPANIVFLIDVSGSMNAPDKLPLVKASMKLLADQLRPQDKVAIVVYAGNAGLVLPTADGNETVKIKDAIERLQAGGSTAGGAGIALAYQIAKEHFIKGGNNRVVLCTDGDFNVGVSSDDALERMIEEKRASGIYLTVLGYGTGNYQDAKMQKLADKGNGNHAYIDNLNEARKVLITQLGGTLFTIAKDVKLQVAFNPAKVQGYRLIGYENRLLAKEDFNDDTKDAGELGSGHSVTALYEIIPVGIAAPELKNVTALKYQKPTTPAPALYDTHEVMTIQFRYKKPDENNSLLLQQTVTGNAVHFSKTSTNMHLAAAVAQWGMLLRNTPYKGTGGYVLAKQLLATALTNDEQGYKKELMQLIENAEALSNTALQAHADPVLHQPE